MGACLDMQTSEELGVEDLLCIATRVCTRAGWPAYEDEYRSAIGLGVTHAIAKHDPLGPNPCKLSVLCCAYALQECTNEWRRQRVLRRGDQAGTDRGMYSQPTPTPVPIRDFELLSFVAAHGFKSSYKVLGMTRQKLRDRLDEIAFRIERGICL